MRHPGGISRNMYMVKALSYFVAISTFLELFHWHSSNLRIAPVSVKQPWMIRIIDELRTSNISNAKQHGQYLVCYIHTVNRGYSQIWLSWLKNNAAQKEHIFCQFSKKCNNDQCINIPNSLIISHHIHTTNERILLVILCSRSFSRRKRH